MCCYSFIYLSSGKISTLNNAFISISDGFGKYVKWNQQESTDINVELIHFNESFAPNATHSVFLHYIELM